MYGDYRAPFTRPGIPPCQDGEIKAVRVLDTVESAEVWVVDRSCYFCVAEDFAAGSWVRKLPVNEASLSQ